MVILIAMILKYLSPGNNSKKSIQMLMNIVDFGQAKSWRRFKKQGLDVWHVVYTDMLQNGWIERTDKDWNALPSKIVNIKSADQLKKVLLELFS